MPRTAVTNQRPTRQHGLIGVALASTLLTACTSSPATGNATTPLPQPTGTAQSAPPTPPPPSPPTITPADQLGIDRPQAVAIHWLAAYHTATWTDPSPAAWIDRVRPYVTDAMHTRDTTLRDGSTGTDWTDFVDEHCDSSVTELAAVVPAESPGTATTANVLVTGTVSTTCAESADRPTEQASATLVVIKTSTGWRVDQRLF